jgi:hypothetical protein
LRHSPDGAQPPDNRRHGRHEQQNPLPSVVRSTRCDRWDSPGFLASRASQTYRSRAITRPICAAACRAISSVAPRFVHQSIHNTGRRRQSFPLARCGSSMSSIEGIVRALWSRTSKRRSAGRHVFLSSPNRYVDAPGNAACRKPENHCSASRTRLSAHEAEFWLTPICFNCSDWVKALELAFLEHMARRLAGPILAL